ncbi:hypothetical protein ACWDZ4_12610 [Streptomyces sp. NPDC003016]
MKLSYEQVQHLLDHRPEKTTTYRVAADVLPRIAHASTPHLRPMDEAETTELAAYLDISWDALEGPFHVADLYCSHCNRHITFLDFVKTAIEREQHQLSELRDVLIGRSGGCLTITGSDGGRPVDCANCGREVLKRSGHTYTGNHYGYA